MSLAFQGRAEILSSKKLQCLKIFGKDFGDGQITLYKLVHNCACSGLF